MFVLLKKKRIKIKTALSLLNTFSFFLLFVFLFFIYFWFLLVSFFFLLSPYNLCLGSSAGNSQVAAGGIRQPLNQQVPDDVSASRQSFRTAMQNPCEYFVDVM